MKKTEKKVKSLESNKKEAVVVTAEEAIEVITKVREVVEKNKLKLADMLFMMHYGEKDYSEVDNIITIKLPIIKSNFECWHLISGSAFSKMDINKNTNTIRIWVLDDKRPPTIIIKDSLEL